MTPDILGIGESSVYVDDIDEAEEWYKEVLQLETAFKDDGYCFLNTNGAGEARQHVILFDPSYTKNQSSTPHHGTRDGTHLALDVNLAELDEWRDRLNDYNIAIEDEKHWDPDQSIYFRDPYNNSLELYGRDMTVK